MNPEAYSNALAVLFVLGACFLTLLVCFSPFLVCLVRMHKREKADFELRRRAANLRAERISQHIERKNRRLLP